MKKTLALLLAAVMMFAFVAGCAKEDAKTPVKPGAGAAAPKDDPAKFKGILDMTDDYTIVIETPGTSGDDRIGVRCEAGHAEIAMYSKLGTKRVTVINVVWKDLGLEGDAWEYLGSTFEFDNTDPAAPKLLNTPEKSCFVVEPSKVTIEGEMVKLGNGKEFKITLLNSGIMRANHLINEGGKYAYGWNDMSVDADYFTKTEGYYVFCQCTRYKQEIVCHTMDYPVVAK